MVSNTEREWREFHDDVCSSGKHLKEKSLCHNGQRGKHSKSWICLHKSLEQASTNFSIKGQIVNTVGSVGRTLSVTATPVCHCVVNTARGDIRQNWRKLAVFQQSFEFLILFMSWKNMLLLIFFNCFKKEKIILIVGHTKTGGGLDLVPRQWFANS